MKLAIAALALIAAPFIGVHLTPHAPALPIPHGSSAGATPGGGR